MKFLKYYSQVLAEAQPYVNPLHTVSHNWDCPNFCVALLVFLWIRGWFHEAVMYPILSVNASEIGELITATNRPVATSTVCTTTSISSRNFQWRCMFPSHSHLYKFDYSSYSLKWLSKLLYDIYISFYSVIMDIINNLHWFPLYLVIMEWNEYE